MASAPLLRSALPNRNLWVARPVSEQLKALNGGWRESNGSFAASNGFSYKPLPQGETELVEKPASRENTQDTRGTQESRQSSRREEDLDSKGRRLAELKTTVFDTYAICSALLASFACSTDMIAEDRVLDFPVWKQYSVQFQQFVLRVCIIGAIHSMLVFMFCALYAKSALARPAYALEIYEKFSAITGGVRMNAFWSMYLTAVFYAFQAV